ncbi:heat shock protein 70 related [Echinococcus multilocularis]|uniref:Heat shock protein 70 related n=1 Tax=Echinococcus multilocularis TaxID=6211 RepID=A0A087VXY6_ECHMU|nr:heat shock protein 70 related [Echinococcus multilocularis]
MVLSKMKETAEAYMVEKVTDAVITVPGYFNLGQRQATIDAAKIAGLKVLRLINEPTAAAIAYGMDRRSDGQRNMLVFDWGGGTFNVSILSIENGKLEVKAVGGGTHLRGEDITSRLVDHCVEKFKQAYEGKDLSTSMRAMSRLREACEKAKRMLSSADTTLTRRVFERLCLDLFSQAMDAVKTALSDAKMDKADIHEMLLVGGSTRILKVQCMLQDFFNGTEVKRSINPDKALAHGATLLAANLTSNNSKAMEDLMLLEITPLSLLWLPKQSTECVGPGVCGLSGIPPVPRGEAQIKATFGIDLNGILNVLAVDKSTGKQNSITIANVTNRLTEDEIEQMVNDAEE